MATFLTTRTVQIPKFLHELHGESTSVQTLILTYLAALLLTVFTLGSEPGWTWKTGLLVFLAFDIGGGVVANLSEGTSHYYQKNRQRRWFFIGIHSLQPMLLALIFPEQQTPILVLGLIILLFTAVVQQITQPDLQRTTAGFAVVITFQLTSLLLTQPLVTLLVSLLAVKLLLAFAIRKS